MMKFNKNLLLAVTAMIACILFISCQKKPDPDVPIEELVTLIEDKVSKDYDIKKGEELYWTKTDLTAAEGNYLMEIMELDKAHIEKGILFENPMNLNASRVIIVKAKEDKDVEPIMTSFKKLKEVHKSEWENYLPDQYEYVKNGIIDANGRYVSYVVYEDTAAIKKIIDDRILDEK